MAYTYDDFVTAANKAGVMNRFGRNDLSVAQRNPEYGLSMVQLMQDIANAGTEEQRLLATEAANQMRKNYGVYSAGEAGKGGAYASSYGSQIDDLLGQVSNYGSFSYDDQDSYQQLLDSIVNQQPFSYDLESDPSYSAYRKQYLREGDRASANVLAQAAAASGGRASSYAQTAAQQAGSYYAGQLADMIPTLEQNAYSRYLSDFNNRLNGLSALQSDRAFDYENWMNEYNMLQNSLANYQSQDAADYQRYLDSVAQAQQQYENALALYQSLGYATPEVKEVLGITSGSGGSSAAVGGGGSGGSGGSGSGYNNGALTADQIKQLQGMLGVTADGKYGPKSRAAAGGLTAEEAYEKYIGAGDLLSDLDDALQDDPGKDEPDTNNYTVTNRNADSWVAIGNGRMTWPELWRAVQQGVVIEVVDHDKKTRTYKYASSKTDGSSAGKDQNKGTSSGGRKSPGKNPNVPVTKNMLN